MRVEQPAGSRGSLKWIQRLVEHNPSALDSRLQEVGALATGRYLVWLSPLFEDAYAEYGDADFLNRIGQGHLALALKGFWPQRGPQWDALASDGDERVFLFEAKAHAAEMASTCQAGSSSRQKIIAACNETKHVVGAGPHTDWLDGYYQYANRIAHLYFLRKHQVEAWLVFLYFLGDKDTSGPDSEAGWGPHIEAAHRHLGLKSQVQWVASLFQPTADLQGADSVRPTI